MRLFSLLPALLGVASVLQAVLNRRIAVSWGLAAAALLNSAVLLAAAVGVFVWSRKMPAAFPAGFAAPAVLGSGSWWFLVPGVLGLSLVMGLPYAVGRLGAGAVFIMLIGAQIVTSLLWDFAVEGRPLAGMRIAGAVLALVGAALTARST